MSKSFSAESLLDLARQIVSEVRSPSMTVAGKGETRALPAVVASPPSLGFASLLFAVPSTSREAASAEAGSRIILSYYGAGMGNAVTIIGKARPVSGSEDHGVCWMNGSEAALAGDHACTEHRLFALRPEQIEVARLLAERDAKTDGPMPEILRRTDVGNWQVAEPDGLGLCRVEDRDA